MNEKINNRFVKHENNSEVTEEIFGERAKKSLGQNFLTSKRIVERIAMEGKVNEKDTVLEIGPGKGILTEALLAKAKKVFAVEKDDGLFDFLNEKFSKEIEEGKLELIHSDVLDFDFNTKLKSSSYKLIANIPYNITGEIIRKFLSETPQPSSMTLLVQKEVAERIVARDGKESILSLSVKVFGTPRLGFKISRGQFTPAPNVDSMVISVDNIKNPFSDKKEEEIFFSVVKAGFAHKRKFLIRNLEKVSDKKTLEGIFSSEKIPSSARSEDLKLENWINIAKNLK
ncbi:MAG: 16S rRNA (adenine(1518)-N(6)/adenine(1519)-N(6))-dimethyltransferase RsmA [bacterium]